MPKQIVDLTLKHDQVLLLETLVELEIWRTQLELAATPSNQETRRSCYRLREINLQLISQRLRESRQLAP